MVVQSDNKILVGGFFNKVNDVNKNGIFRINDDGTLDSAFPTANANLSYPTYEIAIDTKGRIVTGGSGGMYRLTSAGAIDNTFQPNNTGIYYTTALVLRGDKIMEGILQAGGSPKFCQLEEPGNIDTDEYITASTDGNIETFLVQTDGKILMSGSFSTVGSTSSRGIVRINVLQPHTVTFQDPGTKVFGDAPFQLVATSSIGQPVTFTSSNESVISISGNTATIVSKGFTILKARAEGDGTYGPAETIREFSVFGGNNVITFEPITAKTLGDAPFNITASATSQLPVTFSTLSDKISVVGNSVVMFKAGKASIEAKQTGNANFDPAAPVLRVFCINPPKPIITAATDGPAQVVLTSTNDTGNQWLRNGVAITGATSKNLIVTETGNYTVFSTIEECTSVTSDAKPVAINGIERQAITQLNILRNPFAGQLFMEVSSETDHEVMIEVVDMLGRTAASKLIRTNSPSSIDMDHAADGVYIVRASSPVVNLRARILNKKP